MRDPTNPVNLGLPFDSSVLLQPLVARGGGRAVDSEDSSLSTALIRSDIWGVLKKKNKPEAHSSGARSHAISGGNSLELGTSPASPAPSYPRAVILSLGGA